MPPTRRPRVFLDVNIDQSPVGRLVIELFSDHTPRTCENFRQLCTGEHKGLSYEKSPLHRVIDEFMIQGGDIEKGDGTGIISIYGREFDDENLHWRTMDAAGLVCSANRGKDTNGSQFFITLEPCEHLNGKHTIFGHLVSGDDVLRRIAKVDTDKDDRPLEPVLVSRCGELERRKKASAVESSAQQAPTQSRDRGRKRRELDSDVEMENSPEPRKPHNHRRQSDNVVDEGIRGRPRQRSGSRSPSRPLSGNDPGETSDRGSPSPAKHKRKRSPSPSRHTNHATHERRRRSLPNQYGDQRYATASDDEERYRPSRKTDDQQRDGQRRQHYDASRRDDRYRPSRDRNPYNDDGRLGGGGGGGGGGYDDYKVPVKFKGRGVMKYREPERQW